MNHQIDIDKIHIYGKDPYEAKYQFFLKKCENVGLKHYTDPRAFIEYWNNARL